MKDYKPKGIEFYDQTTSRQMILVGTNEPRQSLHGWIVYQHPDGQWVTLRKATDDDVSAITREVSRSFHEEPAHD